jgi:tricorn protease-like protein/C-terminal processing protease CtpA/Prc
MQNTNMTPNSSTSLIRSPLSLVLAAGMLCGTAAADVTPNGAMVRFPDVSATHIVFSYANDLWVMPKTGGTALPLSSPAGQESFARFSPDGKTIAFVGNYEGNRDIYTVPASGGVPTRVTYHSAGESLADWAGPNFEGGNKLLYLTNGFAGLSRQTQLFTVSANGGPGKQLPVPYAGFGALSPDGQWLAYSFHSTDNRTWKRYRGGMATDLWLYNVKDNSAKRFTDWEGNDTLPMWIPGGDGSVVYYLSDQGPEHRMNIWAYNVATQAKEQVTKYTDDDIKWPGIGPGDKGEGEIVFQLGGELRLLNLGTRKDVVVPVSIPGDRPTLATRRVDASKDVQSAAISPTGKRVVIEGRGDLFSAPAKEGVTRNLTHTDSIYERSPSWSPDGKWLAYFSDASGEYELWVRPADAKAPEEKTDEKKSDEKKAADAKSDDAAKADAAKDAAVADAAKVTKAEPRKLTTLGPGFRSNISWSPDSKSIVFSDHNGNLYLTNAESGETKTIDKDPWGSPLGVNWSHDSQWLAYGLSQDDKVANNNQVTLYNTKSGERTQVTSPMFSSRSPVFDRKGDWLFFVSSRIINNPTYSDLDTTFAYTNSEAIYAVPLRADVKNPWAPKSDEEEWKKEEPKKDEKKEEKKDEKKDAAKGDEAKKDEKSDGSKTEQVAKEDALTGTWAGQATGNGEGVPPGGIPITLTLILHDDGTVTGSIQSVMGGGSVSDGKFDKTNGQFSFSASVGRGGNVSISGTVNGEEMTGNWTTGNSSGTLTAKRTSKAAPAEAAAKAGDSASKDAAKDVKIELDGFERRAIQLPITPGSFGGLAVNNDGKLIFGRGASRGGEAGGIKIFDLADEKREEKLVTAGGGFDISADGKKLLVMKGGSSISVVDASAGGSSTTVPTSAMMVTVRPREEWKQIVTDTWRLFRDYFYEPTMHGVDWPKMREHYLAMVDDAACREDVAFIQAELISELNIGHAYITNPGDVETPRQAVNVGLLGCDFELVSGDAGTAYRISHIYSGGDWDADARSPLSALGMKVKEGDFVLAVNGAPIDTTKDIYAAFLGTADKVTSITVGPEPVINAKSTDVLVTPTSSESSQRYRSWIEAKRAYVAKKSDGKVGYIYVPNTGVDGQNDLFRQFAGQRGKAALIIDDRWNGGGQIPTRFIELLNRQATNFWARRGGNDWPWPPDAHFGPKAMLINGLAGSGGDMFPWLFKHNKIGKVFGTRTWGGLVGITGYPPLIDGGEVAVPNFGFYEMDGTWGVEGHGVDPDVEVLDDPSKMADGSDPQLDAAIASLLDEVKKAPFVPPTRPASPNRSGMGLDPRDK